MELGKSNTSGVYTGHHREFTTDQPQIGFIPLGDRDRCGVVSVYGTDSVEERGYIDNDVTTSRKR